jgi:hypothetical protein
MSFRSLLGAGATAAFFVSMVPAQAFDDASYPDLSGQWERVNYHTGGQISFDQSKPWGLGQEAPLTPEYQAILEASIKDQENGGQGNWQSGARCLPPGMPGTMNGYNTLEFVVLPGITYILNEHNLPIHRRIYTDGRAWPDEIEPSFQGYSIGKWLDTAGTGHYDTLEVETRGFKGPRVIDPTGIPTHVDNRSVIKERIYLDAGKPGLLHDDLTLFDHALTRPWTVYKTYERHAEKFPSWREENCPGVTRLLKLRDEVYFRGADDRLMPTRKDQPPPDLRYFKQTKQ